MLILLLGGTFNYQLAAQLAYSSEVRALVAAALQHLVQAVFFSRTHEW